MTRITMEDVAQRAGVSRALVSLAYRDQPGVSPATRARIMQAGEALGYTPNMIAARLAGRGGNTIGVFLQDLHNDLFAEFHDGIRATADSEEKELVLSVGALDGSRDLSALRLLRQLRVDVVIAGGLQASDADVQGAAALVPTVCVFRAVDGVDSVAADDRGGAELATQHLIDLGHREIVFLANPPGAGYGHRAEGFAAAMTRAGLPSRSVPSSYARAEVAQQARAILESPQAPTAVFAHNDQAALGVLDALSLLGLRAGVDLSVIGYDNSAASRAPGTALTTVDVDGASLGRAAAELALRRLAQPELPRQLIQPTPRLVVRTTTGPPRG